ncbi:PP2C family serine/threonine-protein phosphatase [Nioella sp. MMSF_3534]|uniref:PP2C family serine/threonine-protein phosphatase n=1 Tax=Nioella sp. MMSF_3534 TaxID=3046720 RepID=UPI00273F7143|nr:PP2C family serine/threonine-protein phosphatase [Nioella sp. MMSF_3534]
MSSIWAIGSASVIGQSHLARDKPCQDSAAVRTIETSKGSEILLAAVSDGAGSAKYSQHGSKLVCETFMALASRQLRDAPSSVWSSDFFEMWFEVCSAVLQDEAKKLATSVSQLAATALLAVVADRRAMFFQIGDGAIVLDSQQGRASSERPVWVFWPDKGEEYSNVTTFVTSKNAMEVAEGCICELQVTQLAMFTDGIEHAALVDRSRRAHAPFFEKCFDHFRKSELERDRCLRLTEILNSPNLAKTSDDDKSLVLAERRQHG